MNKKNMFMFIILFFLSIYTLRINAQTQDIEVSVPLTELAAERGYSTSLTVTIKNNQDQEDDVEISLSGDFISQAKLLKTDLTIPARASEKVILEVHPFPFYHKRTFELVITAVSLHDINRWSSATIKVVVYGTGKETYHDQPPLTPSSGLENYVNPGEVGLNVYFNPKLVSRDYVLKDGDNVCVGDSFTIEKSSFSGEWFRKGGPSDSPPVMWVDDLDAIKKQISEGIFNTDTYYSSICSDKFTLYHRCVVNGTMICSTNCEMTSEGGIESFGNRFEVTDEGYVEVNMDCPIECIFFVDGVYTSHRYGTSVQVCEYMSLGHELPNVQDSMSLNAVIGERGPDLEVTKSSTYPSALKEGDILYIRLVVKNIGGMKAKVDEIILNIPDYDVLYQPKTLSGGEESEVIIRANAKDVADLKASIEYRSDKLGCLNTKEFREEFSLDKPIITGKLSSCVSDSDCSAVEACCENYCRVKQEGFCDDTNRDGIPDIWVPI